MRNKLFLLILTPFLATTAMAQGAHSLKINEVVTKNTAGLTDEYGEKSGWIEIVNTSYGTVSISSCYLTTDRRAINPKLSVPERIKLMSQIDKDEEHTTLKARKRITFFADGNKNRGVLHTNFKLEEGKPNFIALYDANGRTLLDSLTVPPLNDGESWARLYNADDGTTVWKQLAPSEVTPNGENMGQGQTEDKIAEWKRNDPHGIAMAIIAMSIVFMCLILLYAFFHATGYVITHTKRFAKTKPIATIGEKAHSVGNRAKDGNELQGVDKEIYMAVIAMALKEYEEDVHDVESNILTIKTKQSAWNSKETLMRQIPTKA